MVINVNPNRINVAGGGNSKVAERKRRQPESSDNSPIPVRADINYVPEPESLRTLISSAVAALRKGIRWDRGTILNLLV